MQDLLITEGLRSISVLLFPGPGVIMDQQFILPTDPPTAKRNPIWASASESADVLRYRQGKRTKNAHDTQQGSSKPWGTCVHFPHSKPCHTQQTMMQIWSWNLWSAQKSPLQLLPLQNKANYILSSNILLTSFESLQCKRYNNLPTLFVNILMYP